ncbi:MAG TPA: MliC family protein [Ottowia sp.]|mgnify:CR=1 FL=1|uniref:MliC family protein n=1 Tax=Ottowia sp. TaxID=1898956 RepID=UPI002BCE1AFA|nr:MliC family protein [Ottowia sp.]HMN20645.1 MliC family protein [Ottowia sp.]
MSWLEKPLLRPLFLLAPVLLASACAPQARPGTKTLAATLTQNYVCASGARIVASYPDTDSAIVQYQGEAHRLGIAVSAGGARYVGERIEWWTKGSGAGASGTLLRHNADGTSGEVLELCTGE